MASTEFTIAAVQARPVLYDREAGIKKACSLILEAGEGGATLAAFGETWIPGFPLHMFREPRDELHWQAAAQYLENAVLIPSPATDQLCLAAKKAGIDVVIGVAELDPRSRGTTYCTLLFIGKEGVILGKHRKLKPTYAERMVWGEGDGTTLRTYERQYARISGLNCWEHQMVLPTYAMASAGTQVHVAAFPGGDYVPGKDETHPHFSRQAVLARAFACQTASYVILAGGVRGKVDYPDAYRDFDAPEYGGHSMIIDPRGEVLAGPAEGETILYATASLELVRKAKAICDIVGLRASRCVQVRGIFSKLMRFAG